MEQFIYPSSVGQWGVFEVECKGKEQGNPFVDYTITGHFKAADLHSNIFSQYIIWDYLQHNDIKEHIEKIKNIYKEQCQTMLGAMEKYFPKEVSYTKPTGGMFIWATLREGESALALFEKAKEQKVVFVPGNPFYTDGRQANTMRLNYTNSSNERIEEGIMRLGRLLNAQ